MILPSLVTAHTEAPFSSITRLSGLVMRRLITLLGLLTMLSVLLAGCGGASPGGTGASDSAAAAAPGDTGPTPTSDGGAATVSIPTPAGVGSYAMQGTVSWPDGTPVSNQTIRCVSNADQYWADAVTTDADGRYTYQGVLAIDVTCHIDVGGGSGLTTVDPEGDQVTGDGCELPLIPTPADPSANNKYMASPHQSQVNWQTDAYCLHPGDTGALSGEQDESTAASGGASGWQALRSYLAEHPAGSA